jgi:ribosomal protein S18 acetylase RimI-like enzyme
MSASSRVAQPSLTSRVSLRPSRPDDYEFALRLYLDSTKRLLIELGRWDESRVVSRFKQGYKSDDVQVIRSGGADIGWIQTSNSADELHLDQLHIVDRFRNRGIGTRLIQELQDRAHSASKTVGLNVIRGNAAIALYCRLGFCIVSEDEEKLKMRWGGGLSEQN